MCACMKRVYVAITQVPSEWKERGLLVLSNILHVEVSLLLLPSLQTAEAL